MQFRDFTGVLSRVKPRLPEGPGEIVSGASPIWALASTSLVTATVAISAAVVQGTTPAQTEPILSPAARFIEQSGEAVYANACQACHMQDGKGAVGAGAYPALANNSKLEASSYAIHIVLHGFKSMPPMGPMMSDEQVAAVVTYVRTHFGNAYSSPVTVWDVSGAR